MLVARRLILPAEGGQFQVLPHLRGILERRVRDGLPSAERGAMYARAAAYLWERGQEASALSCWLQGGMATEAAMRLATVSDSWLAADRLDAINKVLAALPDALLDSLPAVPNAGGTVVLAGAELYLVAGEVERRWGNHPRALDRFERAAGLFAAGADASGQARVAVRQAQALAASARMAEARAKAAESRAKAAESRAKAAESRAKAAESRDRAALDASFEADLHNLEGALALLEERPDDASRAFAASLELARRLADPRAEARAAHNLGVCHTKTRDFHRALQAYDSALAGSDTTPALWMTPINRALVLVYLERFDAAEQAAEAALEAVRRLRLTREEGFALRALGLAYAGRRRLTAALDCFVAAEHLARRTHDPLGLAYSLNFQADVMADEGDPAGALARSDEALALLGATGEPERHPEFARVRAKALGALPTPATGSSLTLMQEEVSGMDLEIRCFGGLKVMRPDGPVGEGEWQSSRAKLLLAFLLHHPEGGSKVKLLDWLYPGQLKTDASLHMNIQRLRKALEPGLAKGQAPRFVRWSEGLYTFNRQAHVGVDTWRFDAALRAQSGGTDDEIRRLREALAEITGDFLPEFDTDWVVAMRQRYRDRALGACRRLIELLDQRDPAATLEAVQRALEIDPLAAEFHRELILRFLEAGERHRALEHFRVCERRFLETLGMAPPDDLRDLVT
ncbi:MAG: hypothetical protein FJZ00_01395 [Candidatus Sericytochromatia bacterium]|uniref:Bacterial transcriptional activator domain-containing protein n=1 Tax=Candidatus Tanganyikabacteria bacterium TaxID=2961651 RepID=A0A937X1X7_9BACT|nr:hypothetical protein [Candidatus Tanganyikabacteria bacterium]